MGGMFGDLQKLNTQPETPKTAQPEATLRPPRPVKPKQPPMRQDAGSANTETLLLANQQTTKEAKKQTDKPMARHSNNEPRRVSSPSLLTQNSGDTSLLTTKEKTKYGTYLTDEAIANIKIYAIQTNRDEHQVLQEAVNHYFEGPEK